MIHMKIIVMRYDDLRKKSVRGVRYMGSLDLPYSGWTAGKNTEEEHRSDQVSQNHRNKEKVEAVTGYRTPPMKSSAQKLAAKLSTRLQLRRRDYSKQVNSDFIYAVSTRQTVKHSHRLISEGKLLRIKRLSGQ